jgi:hypothetical protein
MTRSHTPQAKAVLKALNADLERSAKELHTELDWTAAETTTLELIADTVDRRVDVAKLYDAAVDPKMVVKFSAELRMLDGAITRLMKLVNTDAPAPMNQTQLKARRAVNVRWERERARNASA